MVNDGEQISQAQPKQYSPPPLPSSEPPLIDSHKSINELNHKDEEEELTIKKALIDNIKSVDNWKYEQEKLMKEKYEQEEKQRNENLANKFNLERIKDEENSKRREEVCNSFFLKINN